MNKFIYPSKNLPKNNAQRIKQVLLINLKLLIPFFCQINSKEVSVLNFSEQKEFILKTLKKHTNEPVNFLLISPSLIMNLKV
jgi:hypothetical protein